ncbi:MAG: LamG domain-containing protein [Ignisphaera sp.]
MSKWIEIDELEKANQKLDEINEKITLIHDYFNKALNLEILTALFDILHKNYIKLTAHSIQQNDLIAPHLYDLYFDGVNDYLEAPHFYYNSHFTVSVWFKFNYQENPTYRIHALVDNGFGVGTDWWLNLDRGSPLYPDKALIGFGTRGGGGIINYYYWLNAETWYHTAVVTNDGIYVNGVKIASGSINIDSITKGSHPLRVARSTYTTSVYYYYFPGAIEHILIYNRPLSGAEVQQIYNSRVVNASDLWLFIDPTFFDGTKYIDLSGNGNHAYQYNNPQRIDATNKWMYYIRNMYSDGYIRFLLPRDSLVVWNSGKITTVECIEPMFFDGTRYWCLYTTTYKGDSATIYIPQ